MIDLFNIRFTSTMNLSQKIIFLFAFLLLIEAVFLVFGFLPGSIFLTYSALLLFLCIFFIFAVSKFGKKKLEGSIKVDEFNPVLFSVRSVFPFQLFPDHYIVQEKALYIVRKSFFLVAWTEMIPVKDIASVRVYVGPFFASLTIERYFRRHQLN